MLSKLCDVLVTKAASNFGEPYCRMQSPKLTSVYLSLFVYIGPEKPQWGVAITYLTIIPLARVGYEMIDNHLIYNKREWNNCFIKNALKI